MPCNVLILAATHFSDWNLHEWVLGHPEKSNNALGCYQPLSINALCVSVLWTLKVPNTTAADNNLDFFCSEKTNLDIPCGSSAKQTIHIKCQDLFSLKSLRNNFTSYPTIPPSSPPLVSGNWAVRLSCRANWVFPLALSPDISVIPHDNIPPREQKQSWQYLVSCWQEQLKIQAGIRHFSW